MRKFLTISLVLLAGLGLALYAVLQPPTPPEHRVFINGQVLSMDVEDTVFEAISIRGETIDQLGTSKEVAALIESGTIVTDLQGQTLLPGFVDAYGHFPGSGFVVVSADLSSPPVGGITNMLELQDALRLEAGKKSPGEWVTGMGYDDTLLAEKRHPTREDLDAVSMEHPIYITHVSGHMGVGNSKAFELLDINAESEDPEGGVIVRKSGSREPAGLLEETAHMPVTQQTMDFTMMQAVDMIRYASAEYAARGVTTAQSGGTDASMASGIAMAAKYNMVAPRLVLFGFFNLVGDQWLSGEFDPAELESAKLAMPAIKIVADGSIQGYTGYLAKPYHVPFKGDASYRGYPAVPREDLFREVERFHAAGIQMAIHGNGDASIDDILGAFAAAQEKYPAEDPRLILIHAQMARDDQLVRMKELGVTPSFFSAHTYYWGDRHRDIFMGPERASRMSPTGSSEQIGLRYTVHLDTPVVPMQPLQLLWSTVNRMTKDGEVLGPEQRVSPMNALRAMTIDAAWQVRQEDRIGSLEPGKLADIVVLSGDPLNDVENVRDMQVVETLVGGVSVYSR